VARVRHPRHCWPQNDVSFKNEVNSNNKEDKPASSKHFVFIGKSSICKQETLNTALPTWEQAYSHCRAGS